MRHRLEYGIVRTFMLMAKVLPHWAVDTLGTALGLTFYLLDRPHRRVAEQNVQAAFPTRSAADRRRIVRGAFTHFGRLLFQVFKFSTMSPEAMLARVEFEGEEHVRHAFARGKGVLFVTGHFGFWEIQAMVHPLKLPPMAVLARVLDNARLDRLLVQLRTRTGNAVIYRQGAMRRVMRLLQAGQAVGLLIDQHIAGRDAIQIDFFSRPAATTSAVAALSLRTGAPIVPLFAMPVGAGRYRLIYEHPVELPAAGVSDPVRDLTQRCSDVLEMYVRRNPELWLWMHRRWRQDESAPA